METFKVLGQLSPAVNTLSALYSVPAATSASASSIMVCNQNSSIDAVFRISVAVAGAADDPKQYLYYDVPVGANDTFTATIGMTLSAGDVVRVQTSVTGISFNLFGCEVS